MNSPLFICRPIVLILSLLIIPTGSDADSPLDNPTYDVETDFYIVMSITLTLNILNLLGSLYIFYRTYLRWKYDYEKVVSLSIRFPFYIAITDFLVSTIVLMDFSYPARRVSELESGNSITWPSPFCEGIGFLDMFTILLNMSLVGYISIMTWLRVVREYYFYWGKYDYKIWLPIISLSLFIPLTSVREFGAQKYWCGVKYQNSPIISTITFTSVILTLLIIIICYTLVMKTIHDIKEDNSSTVTSQIESAQHNDIEKKTLNKVLTYILVFLLQYIPLVISDICEFLKIQYVIIYALYPTAISVGGLSNLFQYIYNEGFHPFRDLRPNNNHHIDLEEIERTETNSTN